MLIDIYCTPRKLLEQCSRKKEVGSRAIFDYNDLDRKPYVDVSIASRVNEFDRESYRGKR